MTECAATSSMPDLTAGPCRQVDPEAFMNPWRANEAKAVCQACPVRDACLEWAIANPQTGVWGATTERERRTLSRRRGLPYNVARTPLYAGPDSEALTNRRAS